MSNELFELLGLDPDSPHMRAAVEDDASLAQLMRCLYELRRRANLTQAEVAERMGTTQSAVSDLERTAVDPHVTTLQRYARAVGAALKLVAVPVSGGWEDAGRIRAHTTARERPAQEHLTPLQHLHVLTWADGSEKRGA